MVKTKSPVCILLTVVIVILLISVSCSIIPTGTGHTNGQKLYNKIGLSKLPWSVFGKSVNNKNIYLYEGEGETESLTMIFGTFHGDEINSAKLVLRFAQYLNRKKPHDINSKIVIIPILNPDGLISGTRTNFNGVDINRNFPAKNWSKEFKSAKNNPGEYAGSEPETKVVIELIEKFQPSKIISIHTPLEVNNFDGPAAEIARQMSRYNGYPVMENIGYPTPGSFGTYAGIERNIAVITLELPDISARRIWKQNKKALLIALEY